MEKGNDENQSCSTSCGGCCRRCPGKKEAIILAVVAIAVIGFSYAYYLL